MVAVPSARARSFGAGERAGGKLQLRRVLGEGGMGAVWLARNVLTDADVALKVLRPGRHDDAHAAARFRHEARLGAMLGHRNICRVFDLIEETDGSLVLVMEVLRGETLTSYMKSKGPLTAREAVAIISPVLSALQHAHDHDVVHRDIKPSNVFLHVDPDGHVAPKLFDFGIAKVEDTTIQTRTGEALGTPSYMSPEQVRAGKLDGRSDLFCIGIMLYEMITGENPFRGETPSAALARVIEVEVDPHPSIEPRLWIEISRALAKQPYERHKSASELAEALCNAIGESAFTLEESLRREKPPPSVPDSESDLAMLSVTEPDPMTAKVAAPNRMRLAIAGAIGGGLLLLTIGVFVYRAWSQPGPTVEPTAAASIAPPIASASASASDPPIFIELGPTPTSGGKRGWRPPPPRPASSKPIARSPGF